jgi:hypothetical protein
METKPYSLQAPEQVAKDYGGDKQKIAQAIQMGLVDPTAGTLAGMFIDRMRSAAQAEMAPQQTVAQQVFAPPMGVPQGLGATPQAAQMGMAPPQGAPGMVPPGGPPPQGAGLDALPVPDQMFDPGYAGGGLVAFADAGEVRQTGGPVEEEEIRVEANPYDDYFDQFRQDAMRMRGLQGSLYTPKTEASQAFSEFTQQEMTPEALARRRKEDMWMALGQAGARMAQTPGTLLQAIGAGVGEAIPLARESAKERRAEAFEMYKARAMQEGLDNRQAAEVARSIMDGTAEVGKVRDKDLDRKQQLVVQTMSDEAAMARTREQGRSALAVEGARSRSFMDYADKQAIAAQRAQETEARKFAAAAAEKALGRYVTKSGTDKIDIGGQKMTLDAARQMLMAEFYKEYMGIGGGAPPAGGGQGPQKTVTTVPWN